MAHRAARPDLCHGRVVRAHRRGATTALRCEVCPAGAGEGAGRMSDLPFDPEADNAWEAMAKLVALDQMERTDPVMGVWFTLVARQTSAGSTERGLLRERAIKTKVVGNTPVLDQGLAVADFRLQH